MSFNKWLRIGVLVLGVTCLQITANGEEVEWDYSNPEVALPDSMLICKRNLPVKERNECILNSINNVLPHLTQGFEPLGISPVDPYHVKKTTLQFKQGPVYAKLQMKDAIAKGISRGKAKAVRSKVNDNKMYLEIDVEFPKLKTSANYKGYGGLNDLKVDSSGYANITHTKITSTWKILGNIEKIKDEDYMMVKAFEVSDLNIDKMRFNISGIFADPELNNFVNEFVNQQWKNFYKQILPQARSMYEPVALDSVNKIFGRVPFRRLMPKD